MYPLLIEEMARERGRALRHEAETARRVAEARRAAGGGAREAAGRLLIALGSRLARANAPAALWERGPEAVGR